MSFRRERGGRLELKVNNSDCLCYSCQVTETIEPFLTLELFLSKYYKRKALTLPAQENWIQKVQISVQSHRERLCVIPTK